MSTTTINAFDIQVGDRIIQIDGTRLPFEFEITSARPINVGGKQMAHQVTAAHGWFGTIGDAKSTAVKAV